MTARAGRIAAANWFNNFILAVIVVNAIVLGLETYESIEESAGDLLDLLTGICLGIFVVELAIRMASYGRHQRDFFRSGWNVFDFVVIVASFLPGVRENATLLRLVRLARIVRIIRVLPDLRLLVTAMGRSLPGVASLGLLTLLLLYVYGIVGWAIFADHDPGQYGSIGQAMLTLFVMLSLENLPANIEMGRALSDWTVLYFISYTLIAAFLIFNLLIGVVINSLEEAHEMEDKRADDERRAAAGETSDPADDHRVELLDRIGDLKEALEKVERDVKALD